MRHAARQQAKEPAPDRPDPEAMMDRVIEEHRAVLARVRALLAVGAPAEEYRILAAGMYEVAGHWEEARGELAKYAVTKPADEHIYAKGHEDGRAFERAQIAKASVPGPRHRSASRQPGRGQVALFSVKVVAFAAMSAGAVWKFLQPAGRAVVHPAAIRLTARTVHLATGAAAGAGTVAAVTVIALSPAVSHAASGSDPGSSATVPGWHTSATPFPSSSPAALLTKPKAKHAAKGRTLLSASGVPAPLAGPQTGPAASAPPSSSPVVSAQAGPATLSVSAASLDLSVISQAEFTISATGNGWASWRIGTSGTDLEFSKTSGVLQAGQTATITVSLASALDGLGKQVFTVTTSQGTVVGQVTVSLAVPLPSVSADPSAAPSVLSSALPSLPGL